MTSTDRLAESSGTSAGRNPDQQRRHRQRGEGPERAGRAVAVLQGPARDGRRADVARADPVDAQAGGGVILMNASICATQPLGYEPIYNMTKAGLVMFAKCLANEVIADGIRVNYINPGLIMTPDWVKTATLLTAGTGQTRSSIWTTSPRRTRRSADSADRRGGQFLRLSVLAGEPATECINTSMWMVGGPTSSPSRPPGLQMPHGVRRLSISHGSPPAYEMAGGTGQRVDNG